MSRPGMVRFSVKVNTSETLRRHKFTRFIRLFSLFIFFLLIIYIQTFFLLLFWEIFSSYVHFDGSVRALISLNFFKLSQHFSACVFCLCPIRLKWKKATRSLVRHFNILEFVVLFYFIFVVDLTLTLCIFFSTDYLFELHRMRISHAHNSIQILNLSHTQREQTNHLNFNVHLNV